MDEENKHKVQPNAIPGIFLGYKLEYGGRINEKKPTMYCAPISEFQRDNPRPPIMQTQVVNPDKSGDTFHFPFKPRFDFRRQEVQTSPGTGIPDVEDPGEDAAPGDRPPSAIPMPGDTAPDQPLPEDELALVTQEPADPTETTSNAQESATSSPPTAEAATEAPAEVRSADDTEASHVEVSAEIKEATMPKVIKVSGHRKAITVRLMLQRPMN